MRWSNPHPKEDSRLLPALLVCVAVIGIPFVAAVYFLQLWKYDITIPFIYDSKDPIWQLTLTKALLDNGWVLTNPSMGAPGIAQWYNNPAAQASAAHSVLMGAIGFVARDPVLTQQIYFIFNFSLITGAAYIASRLLGMRRLLAFCVGILFAFLPGRFNLISYAFLSSYFMIPLATLPALWTLIGVFSAEVGGAKLPVIASIGRILRTRRFLIGLAVLLLVAITDAYYAFFALLLLGLATILRSLGGDIRHPGSLAAPVLLMVALMGTVLTVTAPIRAYQRAHPDEFTINGAPDPVFLRKPAEADIYSSSLKVLLAPSNTHRIPALARLGSYMLETANEARVYPTAQWAPLGTLGATLFLILLVTVSLTLIRGGAMPLSTGTDFTVPLAARQLLGAIGTLALFTAGASIFGGFGSIVALLYPTIRAYERFPLYLSFLLLCGCGVFLSAMLDRPLTTWRRRMSEIAIAIATLAALFDQSPDDFLQRSLPTRAIFLDERQFVSKIDAVLPPKSMVYQFPYSNYLTDNRYYGWGSFADMRFYLHSHHVHWSSGTAKNSPVDHWNQRQSHLTTSQRTTELEAVGFKGFLVDRTVVPNSEYDAMRTVLTDRTGHPPVEDEAHQLAFWTLPDPGYRLVYGPDFVNPVRLTVTDPAKIMSEPLSRLLHRDALIQLLAASAPGAPLTIEAADHPQVFADSVLLDRGAGDAVIKPGSSIADVSCPAASGRQLSVSHDSLDLAVHNRSGFDWVMNAGSRPLRIGLMELLDPEGMRLRWDGGFRVPGELRLADGQTATLQVALAGVDLKTGVPPSLPEVTAVFALVQEGSAWFNTSSGNGVCQVILTR